MSELEDQIKKDAQAYLTLIQAKHTKFKKSRVPEIPVNTDAGNAYMRAYRKNHKEGGHVFKLNRQAIAFLYLQLFYKAQSNHTEMTGDLAVGLATYDPTELSKPENPVESDPNWDAERINRNSIMLGYWDPLNASKPPQGNGVLPFTTEFFREAETVKVEFFDDWSQEWP